MIKTFLTDPVINYDVSVLKYWYDTTVINYASSNAIYDCNNIYSKGNWLRHLPYADYTYLKI
jgi:hypothetical protein